MLDLERRAVEVLLAGIAEQPLDMLRRVELVGAVIGEDDIYPDVASALAAVNNSAPADSSPAATT